MPSAAVEAAFREKLGTDFSGVPLLSDDAFSNPPSNTDYFLVVQYPVVNGSKPVLGRTYWEEGAARLVLSAKSGVGLPESLAQADTLASLFRNRKFTGVETFVPSSPSYDDSNLDGNWFELFVIVPYRFEFEDA